MRDDELRVRLTALADATAPAPRHDLAAVVERRHRAHRRTQLRLGVAAVAVAAVAVAAPLVVDAEPSGSVAAVAEDAAGGESPAAGGPTWGSLTDDGAFLDGVLRLSWSDPGAGPTDPAPAGSQVLFAGDVPGGRWALVARPLTAPPPLLDDDELERQLGVGAVALAWFAGPPGAAPDELRLQSAPVVAGPGSPTALWDTATGTLVVVSPAPAVAARVVDGNGTLLAELPLTDGVAVVPAPAGTAAVEVVAADGTVLRPVEPLTGPVG